MLDDLKELADKLLWRPMETAPKDGSTILICGFGMAGKSYFVADVQWNEYEGEWCLFDPASDSHSWPCYEPTAWMPLPDPPYTDDPGQPSG